MPSDLEAQETTRAQNKQALPDLKFVLHVLVHVNNAVLFAAVGRDTFFRIMERPNFFPNYFASSQHRWILLSPFLPYCYSWQLIWMVIGNPLCSKD